jgi:hypothetical protein
VRRAAPAPRCLEAVMNRDPRCALSQELEAKQTLLDLLRALAAEDPDFLTDLIEGETNLLELIAAFDASIVDDEILVKAIAVPLTEPEERCRALAEAETLHPPIPGVTTRKSAASPSSPPSKVFAPLPPAPAITVPTKTSPPHRATKASHASRASSWWVVPTTFIASLTNASHRKRPPRRSPIGRVK